MSRINISKFLTLFAVFALLLSGCGVLDMAPWNWAPAPELDVVIQHTLMAQTPSAVPSPTLKPSATPKPANWRSYEFDGPIPRLVLDSYLSRSITMAGMFRDIYYLNDQLRMIDNIDAKFVGLAAYLWAEEHRLPDILETTEAGTETLHDIDPDIIVQAAIFECVGTAVGQLDVPAWVFAEFDEPFVDRKFDYFAMLYEDGTYKDFWGPDRSVPDISRLETKMWYYYLGVLYIDSGIEAIHLGEVHAITKNDEFYAHLEEVINRLRNYADQYARRHWVLIDGHTHGMVRENRLLFDFHSYPLRIVEDHRDIDHATLEVGYADAIYHNSAGGITPSGWETDALPYVVEFDYLGYMSGYEGEQIGAPWVWGYDEITWFALQDEGYRNEFLAYAWNWLKNNDPVGYLEMPGSQAISLPGGRGNEWYFANSKGEYCPPGFSQEEIIKQIWQTNSY